MEKRCLKISIKIVLAFILVICFALSSATAHAATLKTIPSTDLKVSDSNMLKFNTSNCKITYSGVTGKTVMGTGDYKDMKFILVPVKTTSAAFTYTDFLDVTFTNAGDIGGRQLDVKIHFNSIKVGARVGSVTGERSDGYFAVAGIRPEDYVGYGGGFVLPETLEGPYKAAKEIDVTVTVCWHDTGETVDLPFFQCLTDIDAGTTSTYYKEAWEAKSGYSGIYYKYSTCVLSFSGNKATATESTDGDDMLFKSGFYAPTTGGSFRSVFYAGHCGTGLNIYSAYAIMDNPVKESDGKDMNLEGDTINYTVTQRIGKFYVDTMTTYSSFSLTDTLPEGVTYKSAKVYDGNTDITSKGTLKYDVATRKVTFDMGATWLNNIENYSGQELEMRIATTVDKPASAKENLSNTAKTYIDGGTYTSNTVTDEVYTPYKVLYKYVSGTEGRTLPKAISTTTGDYKISDSDTYYTGDTVVRKTSPANGTVYEVYDSEDNYVGRWTLSWDASKKTVGSSDVTFTGTWTYTPAPRLVIIKKIENDSEQFTAAHGEPTFLFKITGKDSGKVWYKSITFSDAVVKESKNKGHYTGADGEQFNLNDGYIYGTCDAIHIPEDDYIVEEIRTVRFDEVSCAAQYHNEDGAKSIGTSKTSITVPLKLSTYKAGNAGFGADYASVRFENEKTRWDKLTHTDIVINELEVKQ